MTNHDDDVKRFLNKGGEIKKFPLGAKTIKNEETGESEIIIENNQVPNIIKPSTQTAKVYSLSDGAQFFSDFKIKNKKQIADFSDININDLPEELKKAALEMINASKQSS